MNKPMYTSDELIEKMWIWIAWRLPRGLVYWCAIRLTTWRHPLNPDAQSVTNALQAWRLNKPLGTESPLVPPPEVKP